MSPAVLSLVALAAAIIVSCVTRLNVGILSVALAWIIGVYFAGMSANQVMGGFPSQLFLTLTGVTLLFTLAKANGTLDLLAHHAVRICRGNRGAIPMMYFLLAVGIASMGPGNIATAALMAPMAMATAGRAGIPFFLMAIMVGNGANAGSLSPFAPTGIIVNSLMARIGLGGLEGPTYLYNALAHAAVAFGGYFALGGWKLFGRERLSKPTVSASLEDTELAGKAFERRHWLTLGAIAVLLVSVIFFEVNVGLGAFLISVVLVLLRSGDDIEAVRKMPWGVIVMVCGVTVLIALLEKTQGLDLFVSLLARLANRDTVTGLVAFVTGIISVYSSTSGVVLPAFLPMAPGLAERLGGADPVAIAMSMNVGSHLVDVSPVSTIGALCIASAPPGADSRDLFFKLLVWGLSMSLVGALICYLSFGRNPG
jgi:Na+/H+ antiporter NhaD/arsenite permease-like protein